MSTPNLAPVDLAEVLALMRAGASVMTGGSRCHSTYYFRAGAWRREDFDEGHTEEATIDEPAIRSLLEREPERAREVVRSARWREFVAAFVAGGRAEPALALLEESLRYGDPLEHGFLLAAFLRGAAGLTPQVIEKAKSELASYTMYHVFMGATGWDRGPENGRKGVLFIDRWIELLGPCPGCYEVRSSFSQQAGDLPGALADIERELAQTPPDDWRRPGRLERAERLREQAT